MAEGIIFDLRRYAVHDGPGIRTTVFLKGCPLRCQWCHNPESQGFGMELMLQPKLCINCGLCERGCPHQVASSGSILVEDPFQDCLHCGLCAAYCPTGARLRCGQVVSAAEVMKTILRDRPFYDQSGGGVSFSGGEPLAQPQFLLELLQRCGKEEIHRVVDTSGYADSQLMREVAKHCDLFLYDLKLMDAAQHRRFVGADNEVILAHLQLLAELGSALIVRVPVIPGINDDAGNMEAMGRFLRETQPAWTVHLLPYHSLPEGKYAALGREYALEGLAPPSAESMAEIAALLRSYGLSVVIQG